jgi:hypothetical protein
MTAAKPFRATRVFIRTLAVLRRAQLSTAN